MPVTGSERNYQVPVTGDVKQKLRVPVIVSKQNGREVMPVTGSERNDRVPVTGDVKTKLMIPATGSKQNGH